MPEILVNDELYYYEAVGQGRPLLLLHGFTGSIQTWQPLVPALADHFQVIMVDVLGHGCSASPASESRYTMNKIAADVIAILDCLDITQASLLGYSMGGRLALYTAVQYPERFTHLILESASPGLEASEARQERVSRDRTLADWIEANGIEAFVTRWEQLPLWQSQIQLSADTRQCVRRQRLQNNPLGLANSLRGMGTGAQPHLWHDLESLTLSVLLIVGGLDTKFVGINQAMMAGLPQAHLSIVSGAGHTVHLERPEPFVHVVLPFIGKR